MARIVLTVVASVALLTGCEEKDLLDDNRTSEQQALELVAKFQAAVAEDDDPAACELMEDSLQSSSDCSIEGALYLEKAIETLPEADVAYVRRTRHDDIAEIQLVNGTFFSLRKMRDDAEWRITSMGPSPPRDGKPKPGGILTRPRLPDESS